MPLWNLLLIYILQQRLVSQVCLSEGQKTECILNWRFIESHCDIQRLWTTEFVDSERLQVGLLSCNTHSAAVCATTNHSSQEMAWCRQATSHYLSQWWPSSMSPYGITRPQRLDIWIKSRLSYLLSCHVPQNFQRLSWLPCSCRTPLGQQSWSHFQQYKLSQGTARKIKNKIL